MEINQIIALIQLGCGNVNNQNEIINYLLENNWTEDGKSQASSFKIITQNSYPLAGAIIHQGNRPRFQKNDWYVTVGKLTTYFYKPEKNIKSYQWQSFYFKNNEIDNIKNKANEL